MAQLKSYREELVYQLEKKGFCGIRDFSHSTWKYYGEDFVRLTFFAEKSGRRYIVKATRGFEDKINNSIKFQNRFNNVFDFIPKGFEVPLKGYVGYATEYIDAYSFSMARLFADKSTIGFFIKQANHILDELNRYQIVHCDLEAVNILISKKNMKLYVIDWDTCCSEMEGLHCEYFPGYTIKQTVEDGRFLYDDAYSFYTLFKRIDIPELDGIGEFAKLKSKIGRNTHIASE